ncbi:MAG: hypothetical protein WBY44_02050 [Bryobacteraceae bacterium]|jgi:hypothetical protein
MVKPLPTWFRPALLVVAAVALLALFTREISDFDFWWTLESGRYIAETHRMPVPDPFAFTTPLAHDAYAGEAVVRRFNLTFEWLAQLIFFGVYRAGGFGAIVLFRGLLLSACCALTGLVAWRRSAGLYRALTAAFAAASVLAIYSASDRSFVFTFFFLAVTLAILEFRRGLWLLPAIAVLWANCHGGFFLQWIAVGAYCAEAAWLRYRGRPQPGERTLWIVLAACLLASAANPNGYRVLQVLQYFRTSFLQSKLLEWRTPVLWPLTAFSALLFAAAAALLWGRKHVRPVDWLLFAAFAAAALMAQRNTFLIALWSPVILASYIPWRRTLSTVAHYAAAAALCGVVGLAVARGGAFQFRVADWRFPSGAADFLLEHHVTSPMFNTYEFGGYLMWRLWPQERVFIDGRALSESVFNDYARILYNHSNKDGGPTAQELLDQYGIQTILMNGFEFYEGGTYNLMLSLSLDQTKWKLVYNDPQAVVFMRDPPAGVQPFPNSAILDSLEAECALHIEREPQFTLCSRALGLVFTLQRDTTRARKWLGVYLSMPHPSDPDAQQAYTRLLTPGQ